MKILSVIIGTPTEDSALWFRIKKQAEILSSLGHEVELRFYGFYSRHKLSFEPPFMYSLMRVSPLNVHLKHFINTSRDEYDLLFCNLAPAAFVSSLSRIRGIPIILDNHGDLTSERELYEGGLLKKIYYNIISSLTLKASSRVICVSRSMMKDLRERGVPEKKLYCVTNATDLDLFRPLNEDEANRMKKDLGLEDRLTFGYIGADSKWQGVDKLIETGEAVDYRDIFFLYVGFSENMERSNNALYIPKVPFDRVKYYYGACDVLVLPRPSHKSAEVAAPTKFAEYAAMGKPILTTDVGDAAALVRKYKCGIVIDDNSPENLLKGIKEFRSLPEDELLRMGKNARKMAEKEFSMEKMREDMKRVMESLKF
jgi:glycosyltransferase involved in cell wall biosynthesis